jgi:gas vesicle protein
VDVRRPWYIAGFLTGCAAGSAGVLLLTPMSGRDLLTAIKEHFKRARDEARAAGREAEAEILTRYRQIRGSTLDTQLGFAPDSRQTE